MSQFPLEVVRDADLRQLCITLWTWSLCHSCKDNQPCSSSTCPSVRFKRLRRFLDYYKDLAASYSPGTDFGGRPVLSSHQELATIVQTLRLNPRLTRRELRSLLFPKSEGTDFPEGEQERALDLAVRVYAMVSCVAETQTPHLLESGSYQTPWRQDVPFDNFFAELFPKTDHLSLNDPDLRGPITAALKATKLKKHAGLRFCGTDDLRNHLRLHRDTGIIEIFHHTAFLKEHLRLTRSHSPDLSDANTLRLGALPRQLALEVLDSIQKVIFPLTDAKSKATLLSLTNPRTSAFDPDCLRFESSSIREPSEKNISYYYFGARLMDLYAELEDPKPRGKLKIWLQRRSGARHVMLATLVGVLIAVLLGFLGLAVTIYQT
ncbi:hypothetical protein EJ08DRAFT_594661 [Tothia fuscella]|uniref:Uncharacterized protein n=1 Tax=Tothia fuscella TaxID=1048955 RepID=A0A9P4NKP4_9PEZI|nr:hypothetical protein EJ08DRAFT_594661 [Tothia fuscella]